MGQQKALLAISLTVFILSNILEYNTTNNKNALLLIHCLFVLIQFDKNRFAKFLKIKNYTFDVQQL